MRWRVPFEIVQDTREQTPLTFDGVPVRRATLRTGDYSIVGFEHEFTVERKSAEDLVSTLIYDRERFERELERMRPFRFKRLLVVAPYEAVSGGWGDYPFSMACPRSVMGALAAYEVRYGVAAVFAKNAAEAAQMVSDWCRYYARERAIEKLNERIAADPDVPSVLEAGKDYEPWEVEAIRIKARPELTRRFPPYWLPNGGRHDPEKYKRSREEKHGTENGAGDQAGVPEGSGRDAGRPFAGARSVGGRAEADRCRVCAGVV